MGKLIRYLRPYGWSILLIFLLLFGQAMADLSLPGFMSDIVNVGIQQGGIQTAVPEAISAGEYGKVTLFMTDAEKAQVSADYLRLDKQTLSTGDYARYVKTYPGLADTPVYKLNTSDKTQLSQLDGIFTRYIPVVYIIEQDGLPSLPGGIQLPPGTDPFTVLAQLPPAQLDAARGLIESQTASVPTAMLTQTATAYLSAQYKTLGMNAASIQTRYMLGIGALMLLLTLASVTASVCASVFTGISNLFFNSSTVQGLLDRGLAVPVNYSTAKILVEVGPCPCSEKS